MGIWSSWLYHYGLGAILAIAFLIVAVRARAVRLDFAPHRRLVIALVGGLIAFAVFHAVWIIVAG